MRLSAVLIIAAISVSACGSREKTSVPDVKALQSGVEPVKFEALQGFLPGTDAIATAGWGKKDMTGMALTVPMKGSQASMTLKKGEAEVVVDIVDTVFNPALYAPVATYFSNGFYASSGNGYKKAIAIGGQPATGAAKYSAGFTGNACTEDLIGMLQEMGVGTGIDLEMLLDTGRRAEEILGQRLRSNIIRSGPVIHGPSAHDKEAGVAAKAN